MSFQTAPADRVTDGRGRAMLSVDELAERWGCSPRHVRRMDDAGRIPKSIKLGSLLRWPLATIEQWEADGCPNCRKAKGGRR